MTTSRFYLFLSLTFLVVSCSSQNTNGPSPAKATAPTLEELQEDAAKAHYGKSDSTLQFNVMITDILHDSKGNYWFGSHGDGLCMYDGETFNYFTVENGLPNGTIHEFAPGLDWDDVRKINTGNQVSGIQEDQHGHIWFVNGVSDIIRYDGVQFERMKAQEGEPLSLERTASEWQEDLSALWFALWSELGIYRYDGEHLTHHLFPHPYSLEVKGVSEIYSDRNGTLWFGTMDFGTFRYDRESFKNIYNPYVRGICRAIFQDTSGRIWLGNNGASMNYMEGSTLHNFTTEQEEAFGQSPYNEEDLLTGAQSIEQDADGNIWFGSFGGGIYKYDGQVTHFDEVGGLALDLTKTIYRDQSGQLIFGIGEGSAYRFDGELFHRFDGMPIQH